MILTKIQIKLHRIISFAALLILFCSLCITSNTYAAAGNFAPPFDIGSMWNICQGYNNTRGTHSGTSSLSLDITGGPNCDNSGSGQTVRSPFSGQIAWYSSGSGSLCVNNSLANKSVMLTHIDSSISVGATVNTSQAVGKIAAPNERQNNGVAHLHMQAWSRTNCTDDSKRVAFEEAAGTRICGTPNMPVNGPNSYNNGAWSGVSFIAERCGDEKPAVYRLYNSSIKKHLYTADSNEAVVLKSRGWGYEGLSYNVKRLNECTQNESVYRFYSQQLQTHLFTKDESERNFISTNFPLEVWRYEGVAFCALPTQEAGTKPVYRFYSETLRTHLFTTDENERDTIIGWNRPEVWKYEGVAYYAY